MTADSSRHASSAVRILAVGEVLWDLLPSGPQMGGAPANFAYHAAALGAKVRLVSRVGNDELGHEILRRLTAFGLDTPGVGTDQQWPTGTVTVEIQPDGQPRFTINPDVAWDHLVADADSLAAASQIAAVCFGTLGQRCADSRAAIRRIVAAAPVSALKVLDINLRPPFVDPQIILDSLALANVLKLNDQELPMLTELLNLEHCSPAEQLAQIAGRFDMKLVALTRGGSGSLLWAAGQVSDHPGLKVDVVDAVGAGDAFTAAMVMSYLAGRDLDDINQRANRLAAFVCTRPGATPALEPGCVW